ncbi:MAG: pyruvate kinase, partial [Gemmatimonadales bacterium]
MADIKPIRRTKIVATLGPASCETAVLHRLLATGVDVVRINSSHGDPDTWGAWIGRVRDVAAESGRHVGVLVDLQGPRIRVGALAQPMELAVGEEIVLAPEGDAAAGELPTTYAGLADDLREGSRILLDDGLLELRVRRILGARVRAVVQHGG